MCNYGAVDVGARCHQCRNRLKVAMLSRLQLQSTQASNKINRRERDGCSGVGRCDL